MAAFALMLIAAVGWAAKGPPSVSALPVPAPCEALAGEDKDDCLRIAKTVTGVSLTPKLDLDLAAPASAVPGDTLGYSATLSNRATSLSLSGTFRAKNTSPIQADIKGYFDYLEYYSKTESRWVPLVGVEGMKPGWGTVEHPPVSDGLDLTASGRPVGGVTYPTSGDRLSGTTIPSGATAVWDYTATAELTPAQVTLLLDPERVSGVRNVVHFELHRPKPDDSEIVTRKTRKTFFTRQLRTQDPDLRHGTVTVTPPSGSPIEIGHAQEPALASIAPGTSVTATADELLAAPVAKGESESDAAYVARLESADGAELAAAARATGKASGEAILAGPAADLGDAALDDVDRCELDSQTPDCQIVQGPDRTATAPDRSASTTRRLPILGISKSGPTKAPVGTTVTYDLALENSGSATAGQLEATDKVDGGSADPVPDEPTTLAPAASGTAHATYDIPLERSNGQMTDTATLRWEDANGSSYGPISDDFSTRVVSSTIEAPALDQTRSTPLIDATDFLYTGDDPVQEGVAPGTIDAKRVAVIRGRVITRQGEPLFGAKATIVGHPEFGSTESRPDGQVYMAVNGGGTMTVRLEKEGYVPVERTLEVPWQEYAFFEDAALMSLIGEPETTVSLGVGSLPQTARGSQESDTDGSRRATVYFPPSTSAELEFQNGSTQPLNELTLQLAEFTVGQNGPEAMPGQLPPTSAFTYAAAFSVREAEAAGANSVRFSQPVISYTENFVGFPVGKTVPSGYYDETESAWVAMQSGRVIKVLSEAGGLAQLDLTGSGQPADSTALAAMGITDVERGKIADLYEPAQTLWRVPLDHFSWVDFNWPGMFPLDDLQWLAEKVAEAFDFSCEDPGSVIECETQVLGEEIPLAGTGHSLNYRTNRVPGRKADYRLRIPIAGPTPGPDHIQVGIEVAGRRFTSELLEPTPHAKYTFDWDGKDAFGRTLRGPQPVNISVYYIYEGNYREASRFGEADGPALSTPLREDVVTSHDYKDTIGNWDARTAGLGGWTLDVHHSYDPVTKTLFFGDGRQKRSAASGMNGQIDTAVGKPGQGAGYSGDGGPATQAQLSGPEGIATAPDGSLFIADFYNDRIRKVDPQGTITTYAGTGQGGFTGDGGPATAAKIDGPKDVAVGPDGSLYVADYLNHRIRKVSTGGVITTVAGNGTGDYVFPQENIPATQASVKHPTSIDVGPDGSIYVSRIGPGVVRKVDPNGIINTIAGCTSVCTSSGLAVETFMYSPGAIALAPDGSLYIVTGTYGGGYVYIYKVTPDGKMEQFAGGQYGFTGDGGPVGQAKISPNRLKVGRDGALYIAGGQRVRRVDPDGTIDTVVGNGTFGNIYEMGDRGSPLEASLDTPTDVAFGPGGAMYISSWGHNRIRRVSALLPGFTGGEVAIPSDDGGELYQFDARGRHLRTVNTFTNQTIYSFSHNGAGYLSSVTDGDGNALTVQRNAAGEPTSITAPFGQVTDLSVTTDGYLAAATNPAGETLDPGYGTGGLLSTFTDAKDQATTFDYDTLGRLTKDADRAGGYKTLDRTDGIKNYVVAKSTRLGRTTSFRQERVSSAEDKRTITTPSGKDTVTTERQNGSRKRTSPDGMVAETTEGGDPRFGLRAPFDRTLKVTTPGGLVHQTQVNRTATLTNPDNPLSLTSSTDTRTVNGRTWTSAYNAALRRFTNTSPAGRTSTTTVDGQGRPVNVSVPGITPTTTTYDSFGRASQVQQGSRTWTYAYNSDGYVTQVTDPLSRATSFTYDQAGRVATKTLPGNRLVSYSYDDNGNLTSVTPPSRPAHAFTKTALDLPGTYSPPSVGDGASPTEFTYDQDRALAYVTRPDGSVIDTDYDAAGRLRSITHPDREVTYTYDSSDRVETVVVPGGEALDFTYDGRLPKRETWSGAVAGNVERTYDSSFRVTEQKVNGANAVSYSYATDDLITAAGALGLTRDAQNGRITATTLNTVQTSQGYAPTGELASAAATRQGSGIFSQTLTRDAIGRVATLTETGDNPSTADGYVYDTAGRLTDVTRDGLPYAHYEYDSNGNRTLAMRQGSTVSATFDSQDRLIGQGQTNYAYTKNGDLRTKTDTGTSDSTTYSYNPLGGLDSVELPDGRTIDYVIDGEGRRVGKKVDGQLSQGFLYHDGLRPAAELDAQQQVRSRFVYGSGGQAPDYMTKQGNTYRFVTDHLGSVRVAVDAATGDVVQRLDYDPFGNVTRDTNPGFQPFGFAGGLYDPDTKLLRFGARDYDPETGRWTAKDPIGFDSGDTNFYGYVLNDPVNFTDPSGLVVDTALDVTFVAYDVLRIGGRLLAGCGISGTDLAALGADLGLALVPGATGGGVAVRAAKAPSRVWPKTAAEMDEFLGIPGKRIPDGPITPGRNKVEWRPNSNTKITHEQHPYHSEAPDWHRGAHWHLDTPGSPHQRHLPGDSIPGYGD